jgi:membrane protein
MRFLHGDGNLLAAGMSYQSLFAVFAAVWVGFSLTGLWLSSKPELSDALFAIIDQAVPGLIGEHGVVSQSTLLGLGRSFGWTGAIAGVGLLWTAISWLYYSRRAIRGMFGLGRDTTNYALQKLRDLLLGLAFGLALLVAAVLSVAITQTLSAVFAFFDVPTDSVWTTLTARVAGYAIVLLLNAAALASMFRVLSRLAIPMRPLLSGASLGAVALTGMSVLSGWLLGRTGGNPLFASFAVIIAMLIWFNLVCRVILLAAAWTATLMFDRGLSPQRVSAEQQAALRAEREREARLIVARSDVEQARAALDHARGIARLRARRRLDAASRHLEQLTDERAMSAAPTKL